MPSQRHIKELTKFAEGLARFDQFVKSRKSAIQKKIANKFLEALKRNWEGQSLPLAPLSEAYKTRKSKEGLDTRVLVATENLLNSLAVFHEGGKHIVSVPANEKVPDSNLLLRDLLKVLEIGSPSANIPSRPIFRLTKLAIEGELKSLLRSEMRKLKVEFVATLK